MKQYFVYILLCNDLSYYTGVTSNIENRKHEHDTGYHPDSYTYNKRPVELVYFEIFQNVKQAIEFEKQIKGWSRKKKQALIENNWDKIKDLAICRNKTSHKNFQK